MAYVIIVGVAGKLDIQLTLACCSFDPVFYFRSVSNWENSSVIVFCSFFIFSIPHWDSFICTPHCERCFKICKLVTVISHLVTVYQLAHMRP